MDSNFLTIGITIISSIIVAVISSIITTLLTNYFKNKSEAKKEEVRIKEVRKELSLALYLLAKNLKKIYHTCNDENWIHVTDSMQLKIDYEHYKYVVSEYLPSKLLENPILTDYAKISAIKEINLKYYIDTVSNVSEIEKYFYGEKPRTQYRGIKATNQSIDDIIDNIHIDAGSIIGDIKIILIHEIKGDLAEDIESELDLEEYEDD